MEKIFTTDAAKALFKAITLEAFLKYAGCALVILAIALFSSISETETTPKQVLILTGGGILSALVGGFLIYIANPSDWGERQ